MNLEPLYQRMADRQMQKDAVPRKPKAEYRPRKRKLTGEDRMEMRQLKARGWTLVDISILFGVAVCTVWREVQK